MLDAHALLLSLLSFPCRPDFDPALLPKGKKPKNNQQQVRLMLPMSVQCKACGEYVHKGKKFNGRKEEVVGETYLGIRIYRLYFRCTTCLNEITFKTDPEHSDYTVERGATRNFEPWKQSTKEELLQKQKKEREEVGDAMKALENRTQQSKNDMEIQDAIEEVRERNARAQGFSTDDLLGIHVHSKEDLEEEQLEELARKAFERKNQTGAATAGGAATTKRLPDPMDLEDTGASSLPILKRLPDPTDCTKEDGATGKKRSLPASAAIDLLANVEVSDSEGEGGEEQKNGSAASTAASAATASTATAAAVPSAPSLPSGLVLVPKKRKHHDDDANSGDREKRKKDKKAKREKSGQTKENISSGATAMESPPNEATAEDATGAGLNSLLGDYDSD